MTRPPNPTVHHRSQLLGAIFFAAIAGTPIARPSLAAGPSLEERGYAVIEAWGDIRLPRLLSTDDAGLPGVRPESLAPVEGDFDGDGARDLAITGVFNVPTDANKYFLVVAAQAERDPKIVFVHESVSPLYLHRPGTTGPGDPGDQAFSITSCVKCAKGQDVVWNAAKKTYERKAWKKGRLTETKKVPVKPAPEISDEMADAALKIAGRLKDVQAYVAELNTGGGTLGTRVEPMDKPNRARVLIYEKRPEGEKLYDAIVVDVKKKSVLYRKRR